jgi:uncharacterized damage-inducible protein DinB
LKVLVRVSWPGFKQIFKQTKESLVKTSRIFLPSAVILFTVTAFGQSAKAPTLAASLDREISNVEEEVVEAAEAMPEERFNFSPESLNIPGSAYKGVRTFAQQVKHIAASNYAIWWRITGDKFPDDFMGGNGPENLKTKADIIKFLRDSFALGHKAAATLNAENMLQPAENGKAQRLHLATFAVAHAFDHYGQMVEYLRMNGIVPPASRQKSD